MSEKTPEQIAAEQAAAEKAAKAAAEKEAKAKEKAEKAAAAKEAKEKAAAAKEADKAEREAKKLAEKEAKDAAKAEKAAAKEANKMPEQNGIRRPKPNTETGKVWALADSISANLGQPTPIANLLADGQAQGLNDSTIRTQYNRWRVFHGITGRVLAPAAAQPASTEAAAS